MVDRHAIDAAHEHPDVIGMWQRYDACCTYGTLADLPHDDALFPEFEFIGSY